MHCQTGACQAMATVAGIGAVLPRRKIADRFASLPRDAAPMAWDAVGDVVIAGWAVTPADLRRVLKCP